VRACFYILAFSVWPTCIYLQSTRWSEEWDATARIERGDLREHETFPALDPVHEFSRPPPALRLDAAAAPSVDGVRLDAPWREDERDGFAMERDEQTGLFVPTFWEPPAGVDELDHVENRR
jgi:hypothetical protein